MFDTGGGSSQFTFGHDSSVDVVIRARRNQGVEGDTVVKLRPLDPDQIDPKLRYSTSFKIELDMMPGGFVCSASFKGVCTGKVMLDVTAGKMPLSSLFPKGQQAFYEAHAPANLDMDSLVSLGPVLMLRAKQRPKDYDGDVVVEPWIYPDGSHILEISTKRSPKEAQQFPSCWTSKFMFVFWWRYTSPSKGSSRTSPVTAAAVVTTMLFLAPTLGFLPQAVLAAVVIVYSVSLIQPVEFAAIRRVRTMEFRWALAAFAGVLIFGTPKGILVAIILSLIGLSSQAAHPKVRVIGRKRGADVLRPLSPDHPDDENFDGLLILRPEGRLFFANIQQVSDQIHALVAKHQPRVLALDMSRVFDIEYSALQMLQEGEWRATEEGATFWSADLSLGVMECIKASGLADRLGRDRLFFNGRAVIRHYQENLLARKTQLPDSEGHEIK